MAEFDVHAPFAPTGDQPKAIASLVEGVRSGMREQVLLGVTGSGKTFTTAHVIQELQRPALILSPNKTLAAQLWAEFREFFPNNAVEYFVSFYDYYQPEAYIPRTDTFIEKDSARNDEIERLRNSATRSLLTRHDVIVVASVSCIYGIGSPEYYLGGSLTFTVGQSIRRDVAVRKLTDLQYTRNDTDFSRSRFRVRGDVLDIFPAYEEIPTRIEFFGDVVDRITDFDTVTGEVLSRKDTVTVFPASHYITPEEQMKEALVDIETELRERLQYFRDRGKLLEAQRLEQRTLFDLEMMRETGVCAGIENYSRHLTRRKQGERPYCLLDFLPDDALIFVDESHVAIPQLHGMYRGDQARKTSLVDFGFRLPSALDNRPLTFEEWESMVGQVIYTSATPGAFELEHASQVVEQIIRPTGLIDPRLEVRPTKGQIDDVLGEVRKCAQRGERSLVTTLTKRMAEDLCDYLVEMGIRARYLHSDIDTLERVEILHDLRAGAFDVLVGINLLREGLDLPEVSFIAILDADKEGYLRGYNSLIQIIGRAARNVEGHVFLYGDVLSDAMKRAIAETDRRRAIQVAYNEAHGITPQSITKAVRDLELHRDEVKSEAYDLEAAQGLPPDELFRVAKAMEREMKAAAKDLQFEKAAEIRDELQKVRQHLSSSDHVSISSKSRRRRS
ncbi:MAG: excinuclease ABC subunit UvrB [Candidatus Dormibacteria bacterium]